MVAEIGEMHKRPITASDADLYLLRARGFPRNPREGASRQMVLSALSPVG
jgi:hypothetical protein